jgi:hemerythrin
MTKFIWTKEYELDIKIFDNQHKHFFEIVNQVYDILDKNNKTREEIKKIIHELIEYGYMHLDTEEKYFKQFDYPDMINHIEHHKMFKEKASVYLDKIEKNNTNLDDLALDIANFSKEWLSNHILIEDKMYVPFSKTHNAD